MKEPPPSDGRVVGRIVRGLYGARAELERDRERGILFEPYPDPVDGDSWWAEEDYDFVAMVDGAPLL